MRQQIRFAAALAAAGLVMAAHALSAQQPAARKSCTVAPVVAATPADDAFAHGDFATAESLYTAMPVSDARTLGLVRTALAQRRLAQALTIIQAEVAAHPDDAVLLDGLGEVRYRRGEVDEAAAAYNRSLQLDPCAGRTHFDIGRYMNLAGRYGSSQGELETAHKLSPYDPVVTRAWAASHRVPLTDEERIARLKKREDSGNESGEQKAATEAAIKGLETHQRGDCEVVSKADTVKIPLWPTDTQHMGGLGVGSTGNGMSSARSAGVDVSFNGQRRRLTLDTGAGGIVLTHDAARALGLTAEAESGSFGIGDEGVQRDFLSHVDEIRIGDLVLHNCLVRVFAEGKVLHGKDGLLGPNVFRSFLVTLDFPATQMRLSSLPRRPDETEQPLRADTDEDSSPKPLAETRRDRYVAPEMKDWTRVFRSGHDLIFPTVIGNAPSKLFVMDTGASVALISPEAAREVTHVAADPDARIHGVSGEVKSVMGTGSLSIAFGGVKQETFGMTSVDTSNMSRSTGTEIAGFIGFTTLRELVIQIDYRDNLVHLTYTPHLGSSAR